jgi:hypothetical protein
VLRARSASVGGWEQFNLLYNEEFQRWSLQSTLNGLFVAMENSCTEPSSTLCGPAPQMSAAPWRSSVSNNLEAWQQPSAVERSEGSIRKVMSVSG